MLTCVDRHILKIPPFPGAEKGAFEMRVQTSVVQPDLPKIMALMRERRVGGRFWGAWPELPHDEYHLLVPVDNEQAVLMLESALPNVSADRLAIRQNAAGTIDCASRFCVTLLPFDVDPWHVLGSCVSVWSDMADEYSALATIAGVSLHIWDGNGVLDCDHSQVVKEYFENIEFLDPFTNEVVPVAICLDLLGFWRDIIDANRSIQAASGFAFWKRPTVEPLLWAGYRDLNFTDDLGALPDGASVAAWGSRISGKAETELNSGRLHRIEVEDGFIRSNGLGADCVPPLSIIVDESGIYFDPHKASDLENIIEHGRYSDKLLQEAQDLRNLIVTAHISKYGNPASKWQQMPGLRARAGAKKLILAVGQVEDDRSVQSGGGNIRENLHLLENVRQREPNAYIIYKPHPDVVAGHRMGHVNEAAALSYVDQILDDVDITELIAAVDHVYVITSLAGFEALMRGKKVTAYGVPFYAGWGLTEDLGNVPSRRTARRTLDELVAATLLLYPRYLDPVTGLPCPAGVLVRRMQEGLKSRNNPLIAFRRLQGRVRIMLQKGFGRIGI